MRVITKNGYIGGRVNKSLQTKFDTWTNEHQISKTRVLEFLIRRLVNSEVQSHIYKLVRARRTKNPSHTLLHRSYPSNSVFFISGMLITMLVKIGFYPPIISFIVLVK